MYSYHLREDFRYNIDVTHTIRTDSISCIRDFPKENGKRIMELFGKVLI